MPAFVSPVDTASWTLGAAGPLNIPPGLRYSGYVAPGLHATRASSDVVRVPATGMLRRATDAGGRVFVEVQVNPFPIRHVATAIPGGVPTFYLVFADATGLTFNDGDAELGGNVLRAASDVTILAVGQNRLMLDPVVWTSRIEAAITAGAGDASQWTPLVAAVSAALTGAPASPVYLYDHAGALRTSGLVDIVFGAPGAETVHRVSIDPADGGNLQQTVARLNAAGTIPIANLWGGGAASFRLRPVGAADARQLVRHEGRLTGIDEIAVTPTQRSVAFTDLDAWFEAQVAPGTPPDTLRRFSRGNLLTPLVNGPAYFDDLFEALRSAQDPVGGFHLAGWAMFPQTKFTRRRLGEDPFATLTLAAAEALRGADTLPLTLEQAAKLIGDAGGATRFLPARFIQLQSGNTLAPTAALAYYFIMAGLLILNKAGVQFAKTDLAGIVLLVLAWLASMLYVAYVVDAGGQPIEPNKDALEKLDVTTNTALQRAVSRLAAYPARVEDNVPPPNLGAFPFDFVFTQIRHFGIYHQKFALVKTPATTIGYCGGIDLNPDRLDDADHLARGPFHDVHARVDGNAVRDLAISFEQRWAREGSGASAFSPPAFNPALAPGTDIVQVGRTYFAPAVGATSRGLPFAPNGDRTIFETIENAINEATEFIYIEEQYLTPPVDYRSALLAKVASREIRQLVIVVPGLTDQLFGDAERQALVTQLQAADGGAGIVRVGYPRRRFMSTDNEIRADSGKLLLMEDLPASAGVFPTIRLGPPSRIPALPFWVSIDGELIYVYDESLLPSPDPDTVRIFSCDRGDLTRLVRGGASPVGTWSREHTAGAAATVVTLSDVYVHAKMMIVDDVFLSIGSANLNRRGFFHDGEINVFTIPAGLRDSARNPALALRRQLWAEMLDLPAAMAAPILTDPLASGALFERSPFAGNRFVPLDARTPHVMLQWSTSDGAILDALAGAGFVIGTIEQPTIFTQLVDPTTRLE